VLLDGEKVLGPSFNLIPGHEHMKLVSQEFYVLENHTVEENIFDKLVGYTTEARQKRAARILKLLDLYPLRNTRAKNLSSGQKQRVAIARALAIIPKILLLDEPFSNLDKMLTEKLFSFVAREVKKNRTSVILITHLAEEALKYADVLAIVDDGKIVQSGQKWEVYYKPKNSRLAGLLGDYNTIRPDDLDKRSKLKLRSKLFIRPDKLKITGSRNAVDLKLTVVSCTYNGKCFEVLCETVTGHTVMVYSGNYMENSTYSFLVEK
jgi:ABC-type Fe3+/spermidine/putrescine transport system ATPase subunit